MGSQRTAKATGSFGLTVVAAAADTSESELAELSATEAAAGVGEMAKASDRLAQKRGSEPDVSAGVTQHLDVVELA